MKAYSFPMSCPVCGHPVLTAPTALTQHAECRRLAYRLAEWADGMHALAESWPERPPRSG